MPNKTIEEQIQEEAGLPSNWAVADAPPIVPGQGNAIAPPLPASRGGGNYFSGSLPASMQLGPDLRDTQYGNSVPSVRLMPVQGSAAANAATQGVATTVATTIVQQAIAALPAPVVVPVTKLLLGDQDILFPEVDPASVLLVDDFGPGISSATGTGSSSRVGQLGWYSEIVSAAYSYMVSSSAPNLGVVSLNTGTVNSSGVTLCLAQSHLGLASEQSSAFFAPEQAGWKMTWLFRLSTDSINPRLLVPNTTSQVLYIGLGGGTNNPNTNSRRSSGIWLRFDTSLGDTTFKFECVANHVDGSTTQGTVVDTGVAADFLWHRLQIRSTVAGTILFRLDNGTEQSIAAPQLVQGIGFTSLNRTAGTVQYGFTDGSIQALPGQAITIVGVTGSTNSFNGAFIIKGNRGLAGEANWDQSGVNESNTGTLGTATLTPAMSPHVRWGNSASGTPINKQLFLDYFAFVFNPALAGSTAASDATKNRYF